MKPREIKVEYVQDRYRKLKARWAKRNERMDEYVDLYKLDLWREGQGDSEDYRLAVPTAHNTVEMSRALLLTRPPVISVPASDLTSVDQDQAQMRENYLYGVWNLIHFVRSAKLAEFAASCMGMGVLRVVYDPRAMWRKVPLTVQALDPRNVYPNPTGVAYEDSEVLHAFKRRRGEIEQEWGKLKGRPTEAKELARWRDEKVEYIDYWRVDVEEDTEAEAPEAKAEPLGVVGRLFQAARRQVRREMGSETQPTRYRQAVTNCVVVDGEFVKKPVRMPGYGMLPFVRYANIETLLEDEDGALSVLFAVAGGNKQKGTRGLLAAEAEAVAYEQRLLQTLSAGAWVTDDATLKKIDQRPGAVNLVHGTKTLKPLAQQTVPPQLLQQVSVLQNYISDATYPEAMRGRYVGDISGLALSALTNPVLMKVAAEQTSREWAYERVNELILRLTEQYAPVDGWTVYGERSGAAFETRLPPAEIRGYYRNGVKLSASLPKDEAGEVMQLSQLVDRGHLSLETMLDRVQQMKGLEIQSPMDEIQRILLGRIITESATTQQLAKLILARFSPEMAAAMEQEAPVGGPQGESALRQAQGTGGGPMQGMPPGVVPPQATPEMVGQGGPGGLQAMMAMQGQAPPDMGRGPGG